MSNIHAWAWPPNRLDDDQYIRECLTLTGLNGVILWPDQWRHAETLTDNGISVIGYANRAASLTSTNLPYAQDLGGIIVGDEPNAHNGTATNYLIDYGAAAALLEGAGFRGWYQLAGLAAGATLFGKYNPKLDTEWLDVFISAAHDRGARVGVNMFWRSANDTLRGVRKRTRKLGVRPAVAFSSGFENFAWWREPVSWAYREFLGWDWLLDDPNSGYAFRGVWCLHTSSTPVNDQSANQWGLIRNDGAGPRLTRTGTLMRKYNA